MTVFTVKVPMLKVEPLFVLDATSAQFRALMLKRFDTTVPLEDENVAGRMFTFAKAPHRVVWTCDLDTGHVLHEVFHLVTRICYDKGITIRAKNENGDTDDETAAYLFENIANDVLARVHREVLRRRGRE